VKALQHWLGALVVALLGAAMACGCSCQPPQRDCLARVWIPSTQQGAKVRGSWDGWAASGVEPEPWDDDWLLARLDLPAGEHGYLIDLGGKTFVDPTNPLTTFNGEREVSLLLVADCSAPRIAIDGIALTGGGELTVRGTFLAAEHGAALEPSTLRAQTLAGEALQVRQADPDSGRIELGARGLSRGRHTVVVDAADEDGVEAEQARASGWLGPAHQSWRDGVLYQVMIDRFRGDGGEPLDPPPNPGARAGGTLGGVRAEIERGSFAELGVTALWLSPVYLNPTAAREGNDGRLYESYHGYWPIDGFAVDERIGGERALDELVQTAHQHGLRVLLDLVPNHVYEEHPRYLEHATDGWFTEPGCVCGQPDCPWGDYIQSCWFAPYLPDFRFQHPEPMRLAATDALWWMRRFDVDGARIDAVPMMPRAVTRRLANALRRGSHPPSATFLLGEVFTGPGLGGVYDLRAHLGPADLDSLFDFPLMWALHDAVATAEGSFAAVEQTLQQEEAELWGSGALLARMLDNHDTPRFVSVAHGDAWGDPWDEPAAQPTDAEPYARLRLGHAAIFTLPGLPLLFQGDELGLAGAGDPDCRRVMPADSELTDHQREVREAVERLSALRACSTALRRGDRVPLAVEAQSYAYLRGSDGAFPALVVLHAASAPGSILLPAETVPAGDYVEALDGQALSVASQGETSVPLDGLSYRVFLRADDPCRH